MTVHQRLASAYASAHAAEVARLGDSYGVMELASLISVLPPAAAAAVLRASAPHTAAQTLSQLEPSVTAALIPSLGLEVAAALIGRLSAEQSKHVLATLSKRDAEQLQIMSRYGQDSAGAIMDPRVPSVLESVSVGQALERVRDEASGIHYYVYVVGEGQRLKGVATLRELMLARAEIPVASVMRPNPERLRVNESLRVVVEHPAWQRVHALPVVDGGERFLGAIRYSRFRALEQAVGKALTQSDSVHAAAALAELYSVSANALLRWAGVALTSEDSGDSGS